MLLLLVELFYDRPAIGVDASVVGKKTVYDSATDRKMPTETGEGGGSLGGSVYYTDQWAVQVDGTEEDARRLADKHGFVYVDKVRISGISIKSSSRCDWQIESAY